MRVARVVSNLHVLLKICKLSSPRFHMAFICTVILDFKYNSRCGLADQYVFYPNQEKSECNQKLLSDFEIWEYDVYDSLHDCCRDKFPNSMASCCDTEGAGGCSLSGVVKWLPDWVNNHCYEKVSFLPLSFRGFSFLLG